METVWYLDDDNVKHFTVVREPCEMAFLQDRFDYVGIVGEKAAAVNGLLPHVRFPRKNDAPPEWTGHRHRASQPHEDHIHIGDKVGNAVHDQHVLNAVFVGIIAHGSTVLAQIQQMHFGEMLCQERRHGLGVGIPDDQQFSALCILVSDHAQWLIAAKE